MRYTTAEVARITGVSLRRLQWLDQRKAVCPPIVKHRRAYDAQHLFAIALIRDLQRRGLPLQKIRRLKQLVQGKTFHAPDSAHRWMLTDGKRVELISQQDELIAFLEQCRKPAFMVIPLADIRARLAESAPRALATMPPKRNPSMATAPVSIVSREAKRA